MQMHTRRHATTMRTNGAMAVTGYTLRVINGRTWRIYRGNGTNNAEKMVEQYYFHEDASNVTQGQGIQKSFPQHHCLMRASLSSAQTILDDKCLHRSYTGAKYDALQPHRIDSTCAVARVHTNEKMKTPFTELTAYQKRHLIARSGMTGLLVSRLFGISSAKPWTIKWLKNHADLIAKYIHSAFACECLIGNRYYYNLPQVLRQEKFPNGYPHEKKLASIKEDDATYDKIIQSRQQLVALYNSNIERLENAIKQFRRGFLSIQTIREDSENKKMLEIFWLLQTQCMKYREVAESGLNAHQVFCEKNNMTFDKRSIQVVLCNLLFSCQAICPKLFTYDIAHLFDNHTGTYARYARTVKSKQLEMGSQGLISAFLVFSAIEPNMVSMNLAPHIEERHSHYHSDFSEYACHIPSRDAIFGSLILKNRVHIPRPVNILRTFFMTKNNKDCFYLPVQETLTELRTWKKSAKEMWKKNKKNFK